MIKLVWEAHHGQKDFDSLLSTKASMVYSKLSNFQKKSLTCKLVSIFLAYSNHSIVQRTPIQFRGFLLCSQAPVEKQGPVITNS